MFFLNSIDFPPELDKALQKAFLGEAENFEERDQASFKKFQSLKSVKNISSSLQNLWPQLAKELGENKDKHYGQSKDAVSAYAAYYLPANALKAPIILEEFFQILNSKFFPQESPLSPQIAHANDILPQKFRVLDLGCGPGTALWGLAWWCAQKNISLEYTGMEASSAFIQEAKRLEKFLPYKNFTARWEQHDLAKAILPSPKQYDLILFSNSLGEIFQTAENMYSALAPLIQYKKTLASSTATNLPNFSPLLLLLEPGAQKSSRRLLALRDLLRADFSQMLPCLSNRSCGALAKEGDWCHEEVDCHFPLWHQWLGENAGLRKEAMLFSYLLLPLFSLNSSWRGDYWRMVSQRLERKGQTEAWFCTEKGKISARVQRSKITAENEKFLEIKRGDLSPPLSLSEKNDILKYPL